MDVSFTNLAIVAAVAFAAPLALGLVPSLRLPSVVLFALTALTVLRREPAARERRPAPAEPAPQA